MIARTTSPIEQKDKSCRRLFLELFKRITDQVKTPTIIINAETRTREVFQRADPSGDIKTNRLFRMAIKEVKMAKVNNNRLIMSSSFV
jgi:hypothetical protein